MMKNFFAVSVFIAFIFFYVRYIEKRSLYIPYRAIERVPDEAGMAFKDITIKVSDGTLINAWWVPVDPEALTILFFHGNGGNLSHRLEKISFFHGSGLNVFIIDYRGYGRSTGYPSEGGFYLDAHSAYDYLLEGLKISPEKIVLYGESLGSAVAFELASKRRVKAVITEGAFTSVTEMARSFYPFLPAFFLSARFDSLAKVPVLKVPKLMIHSRNDEIVPYSLGQKLFNAALGPKKFLPISGGHNDAFYTNIALIKEQVGAFIREN